MSTYEFKPSFTTSTVKRNFHLVKDGAYVGSLICKEDDRWYFVNLKQRLVIPIQDGRVDSIKSLCVQKLKGRLEA